MDVIDQGGEPVRRALWLYQLRRSSRVLAALLVAPARTVGFVFTRDNSCWVYGGVSMDPMAKPARQRESLHIRAVYRYHPCSPTLISSPTTAMMTPITCRLAWKAATCTSWATARS